MKLSLENKTMLKLKRIINNKKKLSIMSIKFFQMLL